MPAKFTSRKSWREKLDRVQEAKIVPIPVKMAKRLGDGTLLIPRPLDVDAVVRTIKKGKLLTMPLLREKLARDAGAGVTCPLCTGIFVRIVAEAANEELQAGKKKVAPYWRVLRENGELNVKFPGGVHEQVKRLRAEGFFIEPGKGKKPPRVRDFDKYLVKV